MWSGLVRSKGVKKKGRAPKKLPIDPGLFSLQIVKTDGPLDQSLLYVDEQLFRTYQRLSPEPSLEEFWAVQEKMRQAEITGEQLQSPEYPLYGGLKFFAVALAYLVEARSAYYIEKNDDAWRKLNQCQFFSGMAFMFAEMPRVANKFRQTSAQMKEKDEDLKNECAEHFSGLSTKLSKHDRLRRTRDHLVQFAKDFNASLESGTPLRVLSSKEAGIKTVQKWLES